MLEKLIRFYLGNKINKERGNFVRKAFLPLFICVLMLCACNSTQDNDLINYTKNFNKIYKEVIRDADTNDFSGTLASLKSDMNEDKILELKKLIIEIEKIEPSEELKQLKVNLVKKYDDLIFLIDALEQYENLTENEKRRVYLILIPMVAEKDN